MKSGIRIYDSIVLDMRDGHVISSVSHIHHGEVAQLKGGSKSTSTQTTYADEEYNRLLEEAKAKSQAMADAYFQFWQQHQAPLEAALYDAQLENVPAQQRITQGLLGIQEGALKSTEELTNKFLNTSLNGVNPNEWANRAGTDATNAANNSQAQMVRNAVRLGLNPSSGSFVQSMADNQMKQAANVAAQRTGAYRAAEQENYNRLKNGMSTGIGLLG